MPPRLTVMTGSFLGRSPRRGRWFGGSFSRSAKERLDLAGAQAEEGAIGLQDPAAFRVDLWFVGKERRALGCRAARDIEKTQARRVSNVPEVRSQAIGLGTGR